MRDGARARLRAWTEPALVTVACLAVWEAVSRSGVLHPEDFPPPTRILAAFVGDLGSSDVWSGLSYSIGLWLLGMLIVVATAVPLGVLLGLSPLASRMAAGTLEFVRTIPSLVLIPLLMFLFGVSVQLNLVLIVLAGLWPLLIQTMYGVRDVDQLLRDTARVYGLSRPRGLLTVVLPSASPYIATGLRLATVHALIVAIVVSMLVGGRGLGAEIAEAQINLDTPLLYARILLTTVVGLLVTIGLTLLERRVLHWDVAQRRTET